MVLGDACTRACRFCAVASRERSGALDAGEPARVAAAVAQLGLRHVVLTMVSRDDLSDGGAGHVAATIRRLRAEQPGLLVEALVGDFAGQLDAVDAVLEAGPDVFAHNVEVVREWTAALRDRRCGYERSLGVLDRAKRRAPEGLTKSSLMVGVGESDEQVRRGLADLRAVGVDIVTVGQYLQPTPRHHRVARYVPPQDFDRYRQAADELGYGCALCGPLVRSSYRAAEAFFAAGRAKQGRSSLAARRRFG